MRLHANARLSVKGRELLIDRVVDAGWSLTQAAEAAGVSDRTARKWLPRYRREGRGGLADRSSAPATVANRTCERRVEAIAALRRLRMTGAEIAEVLSMAHQRRVDLLSWATSSSATDISMVAPRSFARAPVWSSMGMSEPDDDPGCRARRPTNE
jgi:transposase